LNDSIRYFAVQPLRLLWVAAIAVGGGVTTLVFCRLPPRLQHKVKIFGIGSVASCFTIFSAFLYYQLAVLSANLGAPLGTDFIKGIACYFGVAALLWIVFYRCFKTRVI
jgi:hypothetical protein